MWPSLLVGPPHHVGVEWCPQIQVNKALDRKCIQPLVGFFKSSAEGFFVPGRSSTSSQYDLRALSYLDAPAIEIGRLGLCTRFALAVS